MQVNEESGVLVISPPKPTWMRMNCLALGSNIRKVINNNSGIGAIPPSIVTISGTGDVRNLASSSSSLARFQQVKVNQLTGDRRFVLLELYFRYISLKCD